MGPSCKMLKNESWVYLICAISALILLGAAIT